MSTNYVFGTSIRISDLFDGRLSAFQICERTCRHSSSSSPRCLFDGDNYLWVQPDADRLVFLVTRYGRCNPIYILNAIAHLFSTTFVSEYEPQYWGGWSDDSLNEDIEDWEDDHFYAELLKFLAGEPCDIKPGTVRMKWAEYAKELTSQVPELALPANKEDLLDAIWQVHRRHETWSRSVVEAELAAFQEAHPQSFEWEVDAWLKSRSQAPTG